MSGDKQPICLAWLKAKEYRSIHGKHHVKKEDSFIYRRGYRPVRDEDFYSIRGDITIEKGDFEKFMERSEPREGIKFFTW